AAGNEEILPSFEADPMEVTAPLTELFQPLLPWPSVTWERSLLQRTGHPSLPAVVDHFIEDDWEYLVEEVSTGQVPWDAWDDPSATADQRFGWLQQIAEALHQLHQAGALLEVLRPDIIMVTSSGQARLIDLADLLPLPLPADVSLRGTLYSAPELVSAPDQV